MMLPLDGDDHNERNDCKQTSLACVSSEASLYRCTDSCALYFFFFFWCTRFCASLIDCFCFSSAPPPPCPHVPHSLITVQAPIEILDHSLDVRVPLLKRNNFLFYFKPIFFLSLFLLWIIARCL